MKNGHLSRALIVLLASLVFIARDMSTASQGTCLHPAVAPVVEVSDLLYDQSKAPPAVGEPAGDGVCELYCGIGLIESEQWIPACSSYSCTFTLTTPDGRSLNRSITFGPRVDGMEKPSGSGTVCTSWSESLPPGWYHATLECDGSSSVATLDLLVSASSAAGFDIPSHLWRGVNHCPARPEFGKPPSP